MSSILSRDTDPDYPNPDYRITQHGLMAVAWTMTIVSLVFQVARLVTRMMIFHKLGWDDFLASLAWILMLAFTVLLQTNVYLLYWQFDIVGGRTSATPEFMEAYATFMKCLGAWLFLFYFCLWSIKFSFLIFFRQLNSKARSHQIWWWVVFAVVTAGLITALPLTDFKCILSDWTYIMTECMKGSRVQAQGRRFYGNAAVDIFTDLLILSIPIMILWNVQIPRKKKAILLALFSVTILIVAIALVRVILIKPNPTAKQNISMDWLLLWSLIEMAVAIMIASVASFRQLFVSKSDSLANRSSSSGWTSFRRYSEKLPFLRSSSEDRSETSSGVQTSSSLDDCPSTNASKSIHVHRAVDITTAPVSNSERTYNSSIGWNNQHPV